MQVINGWTIERDGAGFYAVAGTVRVGPYSTPVPARDFAEKTTPPKTEKPRSRDKTTALDS